VSRCITERYGHAALIWHRVGADLPPFLPVCIVECEPPAPGDLRTTNGQRDRASAGPDVTGVIDTPMVRKGNSKKAGLSDNIIAMPP
jgi:hypothetical protein